MKKLLSIAALMGLWVVSGCASSTVEGPAGKSLSLTVPRYVTLERGQSQIIEVQLTRTLISNEIEVVLTELPRGVSVGEKSLKTRADRVTFALKADPDAALVANHRVVISARGPDGMSATESVLLTVR